MQKILLDGVFSRYIFPHNRQWYPIKITLGKIAQILGHKSLTIKMWRSEKYLRIDMVFNMERECEKKYPEKGFKTSLINWM